ncbi:hypothetical protein HGM15179_013120, partial [Zosterops borbonicus]
SCQTSGRIFSWKELIEVGKGCPWTWWSHYYPWSCPWNDWTLSGTQCSGLVT